MLVTVCNTCKKILDDTMPLRVCAWQDGETLSFRKWTEIGTDEEAVSKQSHFCTPGCAVKFFEDWLAPVLTVTPKPASLGRLIVRGAHKKHHPKTVRAVATKTVPAPVETDPVKKIVMDDEGWA